MKGFSGLPLLYSAIIKNKKECCLCYLRLVLVCVLVAPGALSLSVLVVGLVSGVVSSSPAGFRLVGGGGVLAAAGSVARSCRSGFVSAVLSVPVFSVVCCLFRSSGSVFPLAGCGCLFPAAAVAGRAAGRLVLAVVLRLRPVFPVVGLVCLFRLLLLFACLRLCGLVLRLLSPAVVGLCSPSGCSGLPPLLRLVPRGERRLPPPPPSLHQRLVKH